MKRVKRYVSVLLTLCMVLGLFPASVSASEAMTPSEKKEAYCDMDKSSISAPMMLSEGASGYIRNTYIEAYIASNGQFTMGTIEGDPDSSTDNNKKLLFGHPDPWSSETLVRIDDVDYWFHEHVTDVSFTEDNQCISTAVISGVEVRQILTLMKNPYTNLEDLISIQYAYTNTSSTTKQIGIRIMLDTMLGNNDGAPFRVNGADVVTEVEYTGNSVPQYWQSFDSLEQPNVTATGFFYFSNTEAPDKVQFAHWGSISGSDWDYQVTSNKSVTGDSAVAAYFNPRAVAAGGSNSVVTYYGISGFSSGNSDLDGDLAVRVTAPSSLYGSDLIGGYLNNPFDVSVYLTNYGTDTLSDVKAVLSLDDPSKLTVGTSQATTLSVGNMAPGSNYSLQWTLRAIPQGSTSSTEYSISFYEGADLLKTMHFSLSLYELNEEDMYRTVSFDLNGGDGTPPASQYLLIGSLVERPANPTREGYIFNGWYANRNGSGLPWFNLFNLYMGNLVTNNVTLYAKWRPDAQSLEYGTDTFSFTNTTPNFFSSGVAGTYELTGDYYDVLLEDLGGVWIFGERQRVKDAMKDTWGGSCFGMSAALALIRAGDLDVAFFQDDARCTYDLDEPADNSTIFNLINYYHLMQNTSRTRDVRSDYDSRNETSNNEAVVSAVRSSFYPVVVGFDIKENGKRIGGHAVIAYGYTYTDSEYLVQIWDPNNRSSPNTLHISRDYTTSYFETTYDSGTWTSYIKYALTVESGDYDYKNIQDQLLARGYSSGAAATALMSRMASERSFLLETNYDDFTVCASDGTVLAEIEDGVKISGALDISDAAYLNEAGNELDLLFTIHGTDEDGYTILPILTDSVVTGEPLAVYSTSLSCDDADGFYTSLHAAGVGALDFSADGTLRTSFVAPTEQSITAVANDAVTPWYAVTVQSSTTSMTVAPGSSQTSIVCAEEAQVTVTAEDDYNTLVFETCTIGPAGITLTEDPENPGTGVLGAQTGAMGHSLIFYTLGGTPIAAQTDIPTGGTATRPADPVRNGFVFAGWYTAPGCADGQEWSFDTPITEDVRIYAKWLTDDDYIHTVTFKADGQDDIIVIVRDGETLSSDQLPAVPEKIGFTGAWDITDFSNIHADLIVNAIYTPSSGTVTVTYTDGVDGAEVFADQVYTVELGDPTPAFSGTPSRTGYTFAGWNPTVTETVSGTVLYTAQWTPNGGSSGGGGTTSYTIKASAGDGGSISPDGRVRVDRGDDQTFRITPDDGYEIADVLVDGESVGAVSSYTFENVRANHTIEVVFERTGSAVADPDDTGVSDWLNTEDHNAYLNGYPGSLFGPDNNMTRAEVAQMFYNLLQDKNVPITVTFDDVPADAWYTEAVNTLASLDILNGVGNNKFEPERSITRAEFTTIAMRFTNGTLSGTNIFPDVNPNDWFYDYVVGSIQYGWINGYPDGTFGPNDPISRAEVTTITNRMLGRSADEAFVDSNQASLVQFGDITDRHWAYYQVMEATNAHDYTKTDSVEDWTSLN